MINNNIKTRAFEVINYLRDEEDIAAYLRAATKDGDQSLLAAVLGDVDRALGKTPFSRGSVLSKESFL